jgi:hypothetical protein
MDAFWSFLVKIATDLANAVSAVYEWLGPHAAVGVVALVVLVVMVVQTEREGTQEDS